ncbi:MAG: hypothetical protein QOG64_1423 [Acidimicrobiaceae bacterium]|nr:hypothetical protein [Acidimicrobiaceae bacterium]
MLENPHRARTPPDHVGDLGHVETTEDPQGDDVSLLGCQPSEEGSGFL